MRFKELWTNEGSDYPIMCNIGSDYPIMCNIRKPIPGFDNY
jgi:hypothetical protein